MQTFMTYSSFARTARSLDDTRLGNQIRECGGIFDHLTGLAPKFYPHHPVMKMWRGYEFALAVYTGMLELTYVFERGFTGRPEFWSIMKGNAEIKREEPEYTYVPPPWTGDTDFMRAMRSNLVRKNESYYGPQWSKVPENWPYLWPYVDSDTVDGYELYISKNDQVRIHNGERAKPPRSVLDRVVNWDG